MFWGILSIQENVQPFITNLLHSCVLSRVICDLVMSQHLTHSELLGEGTTEADVYLFYPQMIFSAIYSLSSIAGSKQASLLQSG